MYTNNNNGYNYILLKYYKLVFQLLVKREDVPCDTETPENWIVILSSAMLNISSLQSISENYFKNDYKFEVHGQFKNITLVNIYVIFGRPNAFIIFY